MKEQHSIKQLFSYQLKAIRDMQEQKDAPVNFSRITDLLGLSKYGGKSNMLAYHLSKLDKETRDKILANTVIVCPSFDYPSNWMGHLGTDAVRESELRLAAMDWPQGAGKTSALCRVDNQLPLACGGLYRADVHVAVSGGGRVPPRPIDRIHVRRAAAGLPPRIECTSFIHTTTPEQQCAERPNTTDMYRMYRDQRRKPKRGRK